MSFAYHLRIAKELWLFSFFSIPTLWILFFLVKLLERWEMERKVLGALIYTNIKRGLCRKGVLPSRWDQKERSSRDLWCPVPVVYLNHPFFMQLLKAAEEDYGFDQKGTITIPCLVQQFRDVRNLIDRDKSLLHHHRRHHHVGCFRV
ncbi:hypothetical protein V6N12_022558 [Hibiscus sabdariffa]|uniref:Uncharacterized protein n=1 Tax=Hibiscus sabdariffa TaxID=183260 RepID=A0ABR2FV21_9ROSI